MARRSDVSSIVSGLMQVQDIPLTELENQVTTEQAEVSAYGSLSSALSTFQSVVANAADGVRISRHLTASVGSSFCGQRGDQHQHRVQAPPRKARIRFRLASWPRIS